jgi:DNA-binding transcriptional regulator YiaG
MCEKMKKLLLQREKLIAKEINGKQKNNAMDEEHIQHFSSKCISKIDKFLSLKKGDIKGCGENEVTCQIKY